MSGEGLRHDLTGRTVVLSGGAHGIGGSLAVGLGRAGANVVLVTRPRDRGPSLRTQQVRDAIETTGAQCRVVEADVRDEAALADAVDLAAGHFGGVDACVNNASALSLAGTETVPMAAFDLMMQVNVRGTFALTRLCLAYLRASPNPHILTISPPLDLVASRLGGHPPYALSKYGMTVMALGWAAEFADTGIASNCLWPERTTETGSVLHLMPEDATQPEPGGSAMTRAVVAVLASAAPAVTGRCLLDGEVLRSVAELGRVGGA